MKKLLSLVVLTVLLFSCNNPKKSDVKRLPESGGTLNNLTIVTSNKLWAGEIGDAAREVFAASVYGLPQDEPMFNLKQIQPKAFHELIQKSRTFVQIETGKPKNVKYINDLYATPQLGIIVSGKDVEEVKSALKENATAMVDKIKAMELDYKITQMRKNPFEKDDISETFGIDVSLLFSYRVAKKTDNFMWLRKDIKNGTMNLMIYELPYQTITNDSVAINHIIKLRDSIGKAHIPGPKVGETYMITEKAYTPYLNEAVVNNMNAIETKGTWEVKNDFMAGPFVNYIIDDKKNKRQLVLEGFTYAPQVAKRDYMFELEAVIKSLEIE